MGVAFYHAARLRNLFFLGNSGVFMDPQQFQAHYRKLVDDYHSHRIDWNVFESRLFVLIRQRTLQAVADTFPASVSPSQPATWEATPRPALPDMRAVADSLGASSGRFQVHFAEEPVQALPPRAADFGFTKTFFTESGIMPPMRDIQAPDPFQGLARRGSRFSPGTMIGGVYRLQRPMGMGQCGETWRAEEIQTGNYIVVKPLPQALQNDRKAMKRFYRVFRRIAALRHPGICTPLGIGKDLTVGAFLVEPFLDARYLDEYYEQYRGFFQDFPASEALRLLRPMGEALDYAHRKGVSHRMLKPQNILVGRHCGVMLTDFQFTQTVRSELSLQGIGTEAVDLSPWQAPEIWTAKQFGPAADQFALGVIAFRLLTGKLPFPGRNTTEIRDAILHTKPVGLDKLDKSVAASMERALSKETGDRYPGVRDFLDDLSTALTETEDSSVFDADEVRDDSRPWPFPDDDELYDMPIAAGSTYPYTIPPQRVRGAFSLRTVAALLLVALLLISASGVAVWHGTSRGRVASNPAESELVENPVVPEEIEPVAEEKVLPTDNDPTTSLRSLRSRAARRPVWGANIVPVKEEELPELTKKAHEGSVDAQRRLGEAYFYGKGVSSDYAKAFEYFSLAAEQDDPSAVFHIARCYELGLGVQKSVIDAIELFRRGADLGSNECREALVRLRVND